MAAPRSFVFDDARSPTACTSRPLVLPSGTRPFPSCSGRRAAGRIRFVVIHRFAVAEAACWAYALRIYGGNGFSAVPVVRTSNVLVGLRPP